jgi:hypothetical protein
MLTVKSMDSEIPLPKMVDQFWLPTPGVNIEWLVLRRKPRMKQRKDHVRIARDPHK